MTEAEKVQLEDSVKNVTLAILDELVKHKIKGADLIKQGLDEFITLQPQLSAWWETLKVILTALKPFFEIAREWIAQAYSYLLAIFDWAKAKWHEIFG